MPGLNGHTHGRCQRGEGVPVPVPGQEGGGEQGFPGPDGNGVALHILGADIDGSAHGKSQSLPLPQGIAGRAPVMPDNLPLKIQKISLRIGFTGVPLQKRAVVTVGNKADVLAVPLPGVDEAILLGNLSNLSLCQPAQRKLNVRHLFLIQAGKKIGLILCPVRCLIQQVPAADRVLPDLGVVPRNYPIASQLLGPAEKPVKFQMAVTVDAGIGGQTLLVAGYKFLNDLTVKIVLEIKYIVANAQTAGNCPGIFHIIQRTAGAFLGAAVVQPHGGSDAFIASLFHEIGGNGAVYAAAHADYGPLHSGSSFFRYSCGV